MNPVNRYIMLRHFFQTIRNKFVSLISTDIGFSFAIYIFALWAYGIEPVFFNEENDSEDDSITNSSGFMSEDEPSSMLELTPVFVLTTAIFFAHLFFIGKLAQAILFNRITNIERKTISYMLLRFVIFRMIIFSGAINTGGLTNTFVWIVWFGFLGLLHSILLVASSRCVTLSTVPFSQKGNWIRMAITSSFLLLGNWYLLKYGLQFCVLLTDVPTSMKEMWNSSHNGREKSYIYFLPKAFGLLQKKSFSENEYLYDISNIVALLFSECVLLFSSTLYLIGTLAIQFYDRWLLERGCSWNSQSTYSYYLELSHTIFCRFFETAHYFQLLLWSRMFSVSSLMIFFHLRSSFSSFLTRVRRHVLYRRFNKYIAENFPLHHAKTSTSPPGTDCDATTDLKDKDSSSHTAEPEVEICAICWERMISWRCLPCRHIFHDTCLRSWLLQNPSCPSCRRDLHIPPILLRATTSRQAQAEHPIFGLPPQNVHHVDQPNTLPAHQPTEVPPNASNEPVSAHAGSVHTTTSVGLNFGMDLGGANMVYATARATTRGTNGSLMNSGFPHSASSLSNVSTNTTVSGPPLASPSSTTTPTMIINGSPIQGHTFHFDGSRYFSWLPSIHFEWSGFITQVLRIPLEPTTTQSADESSTMSPPSSLSASINSTLVSDHTTAEMNTSEENPQISGMHRASTSDATDVTMSESVELRHRVLDTQLS